MKAQGFWMTGLKLTERKNVGKDDVEPVLQFTMNVRFTQKVCDQLTRLFRNKNLELTLESVQRELELINEQEDEEAFV